MSTLKNLWQKKRWIFWLLIVALLCVPPMLKILGIYKIKALYLRYACNIMMYATLAGSLNVINGYSGQTCLGQAGFFAIGAYTCAILSTRFGVSFWVLLPLCGLASGLIGLLVTAATQIGVMMIGIAGLSFLGIGVIEPQAEWGSMINTSRAYLQLAPWAVLAPAVATIITVMVFNYLGDCVRDALEAKEAAT